MRDDVQRLTSEVAIVGGGPVGLVLSLFLDLYGVKTVIFNVDDHVRQHPKGSAHNSRTMEHYRRLGISTKIRQLGLPPDHPKDAAYFTRLSAWEIARFHMPSEIEVERLIAGSSQTDQIPEPMHRANQMYVDASLLKHAGTRPNIKIRFGWKAHQFNQNDDGVSLTAEHVANGQTEHWHARYLIGCDGGQSEVRRFLGIRYHGYDRLEQAYLGGRMMSSYFRAPTLYRDHLGRRRAWVYWVINPEVRTTIFSLNGDDEFMIFTKPKNADAQPEDAAVRLAVQRSVGAEIPVEIVSHRPWTAGAALVAERFADRRIKLAGDAAHLFTPTGGFGMNTGIDDVANLAWKLAAVLQGWGGIRLLDSYELERRPIAARNTTAARAIAKQVGAVEIPSGMEENSPSGAAQRQEVGALVSTYLSAQFAPLGIELGARYDGSPLIVSEEAAPTDSIVQYIPTGAPGGRAPHFWVGTGRSVGDSLFDRFGTGFTLLRLGPKPPAVDSLAAVARDRGIPLDILDVAAATARELYGSDLALVRPDQHIAWRGNVLPPSVDSMLNCVTGG
jgi:2-polyprenyl-6-methoxyphenol hydroxylase-like FAD-dependent oxidoreductase